MINALPKHAPRPQQWLGQMESLCDMTRLRVLHLIEQDELGVTELCDILQLPQSTVSRHLRILLDQGWTTSRRNGSANLYRMFERELNKPARHLWTLARDQFANAPSIKQDQLRLARRLRQRQSGARKFFEGIAGEWDQLRSQLYGNSLTTDALGSLLPSNLTIADLGCGTGLFAAHLAPYVKAVIGVDQSQSMLDAAAKRTAEFSNVELRLGELLSLPLNDGQVDAVVLSIVLTYTADVRGVLGEAHRVVKDGGKVVIIDLMHHDREDFRRQMDQHWPGFEPVDMEHMLRHNGFQDVRCRPLPTQAAAKGPALILATACKSPAQSKSDRLTSQNSI